MRGAAIYEHPDLDDPLHDPEDPDPELVFTTVPDYLHLWDDPSMYEEADEDA